MNKIKQLKIQEDQKQREKGLKKMSKQGKQSKVLLDAMSPDGMASALVMIRDGQVSGRLAEVFASVTFLIHVGYANVDRNGMLKITPEGEGPADEFFKEYVKGEKK